MKEVLHIHIESYNEVDVPMIKQGFKNPVFIQMSLIIGPNPKKLGSSSKLLQISTFLYFSGAILSCIALIALLATHFTTSDLQLKHDIYLEREKMRVLREDEKLLKRALMRFINEHGGTIREWR